MTKLVQNSRWFGFAIIVLIIALLIGSRFNRQVLAETLNVVTHDDNAIPPLSYTGSWTFSSNSANAMSSTLHWSNVSGNKVTYSFNGTRITRFYSMASNRGSEAVYIDGVLKGVYSSYASETRRQVARTWDNLPTGNHTIEVYVNGGGYSDIDAFAVDIATVNTGAYDNPHSQIRYFGNWADSSYTIGSYNNSLKVSNTSESGFRFTFSGDEITYLYSMHSNRGMATITIDGSNKGTIDQYSSDLRRQIGKTFSGLGSGVHVLTVTNSGAKNIASTDYYIDLDGLIVGNSKLDNTNSQVTYQGAWANSTVTSGTYNNSLKVSNTSGASFRFTFNDDEITYIYSMDTNRGIASVAIDGVYKGLIDQYSNVRRRQVSKTFSGLGAGQHEIEVTNSGARNNSSTDYYIDLDALLAGSAYDRAAAVGYADTWAHGRNSNYPNIGTGSNCDDCTNFVSQVIEAGGLPQIANPSLYNSNYYWFTYYILGWIGSNTWQVTSAPDIASFKSHIDIKTDRFHYVGNTSSAVETLVAGDIVLMDLVSNDYDGADHASIIVGWGNPVEGDQTSEWRLLRNAHCTDRKRVRWDYNVNVSPSNDKVWAYHVTY